MSEQQSLEFLLFSGAYDEVLRRTAEHRSTRELPYLVGALSLSGRLEEAESAFTALGDEAGDTEIAEARFFLIAGFCHAGALAKALRHAREIVAHTRNAHARPRFFAFQGLAALRYFEGRFLLARRLGRRALGTAVAAAFPYGRFLALDLMAHTLIHLGEVFAGLRLLGQAQSLAEALGYADNAATLKSEALVLSLSMLVSAIDPALANVETAIRAPAVSYFTRRNGLIELARAHALRGRARLAAEALDEARLIALAGTDRRAKTRLLVCTALTTALSRGADAARAFIEEARAIARGQLTLTAEVAFIDILVLGCHDPEVLAEYALAARRTGIQRARVACDVAAGASRLPGAHVEDGLLRLLLEGILLAPAARIERVIATRLFGLVPWALGLVPGRRILVTADGLVTENHGEVSVREMPSRPSLKLLFALRDGYQSRPTLIAKVWGIARYAPERHIAVIHTAVSRLRQGLGEPDWIVTQEEGYSLADSVEIVNVENGIVEAAPGNAQPAPSSLPAARDDHERALAFVRRHGSASSAEVARALKLSASSALRLLRRLAEEGALEKTGSGRATRYSMRS